MDASESPIALIYSIPGLRQLILLAGLALAISAGVTAAFWMKDPGYTVLFSNISQQEAGEMVDALNATDIPHRVDEKTGAVLVPSGKVQEARLKLAGQGLPRGSGSGLEMMDNGNAFATSQFMETARYNHALETELGRTISTLRPVQSARVHLALPESSVFLRKKKEPSASVLVNLYSGRDLDKSQVASVVHLVASSIPGLEPDKVTVVDQHGRLLNAPQDASQLGLSTQQLDYVQRVEESYTERINSLLSPMLGADRVRATVTAEMDFTEHEETREQYDPEKTTVRSEQVAEDRRNDASSATGGVPGALSNTPPPPAVANNAAQPQPAKPGAAPTGPANAAPAAATTAAGGVNESMRRTRNFEVDRTLSHTRQPTGQLKRLSVAVVIDDKRTAQEDGTVKTEHLTQPEIDEITRVVKEAVGLDEKRGDTVSISNVAFYTKPAEAAPAEPGLLDRPGLMENGRNIIAALLLLGLAFVVIRPIMRGLGLGSGGAPQGSGRLVSVGAAGGGGAVNQAMSRTPLSYDDKISVARQLADKNPERVAQIVRAWVQSDE
jgi:flagellar M-ring protein FliF